MNHRFVFVVLAVACRYAVADWQHPLAMGRGGVWSARFPVVIENHTHSALEGAPVALEVGEGAGQAPLAGARAEAVRVVDGRGAQLLFRLQAPGQSEAFTAGAVPADATLVLPAVCGPVTSVTYTVYFDNPKAWALADSLSVKSVTNSAEVAARAGAVERLALREEGGDAAWASAGSGRFWRLLSAFLPGPGDGDGWHHRTPVFVTNVGDTDETNVLASADLISAAHGVVTPRFLLTFNGKPVAARRLGDRLLFSCSAPARSVLTYYLYVADTGERQEAAKVSASALGGELPSDQVLSERCGTADANAVSDLLGGSANLMKNPGFERGGDLPEVWEASAAGQGVSYSLASSGGDGTRYARLTVSPSAPAGWYGWRQRAPVKPGRSYLYGASVACEGLDGTAKLTVSLRDNADRLVGYHISAGQTVAGDAPWTPMLGAVTVPSGASQLLMSLTMNVHGTLKHDNAFLVECHEAEMGDPDLPARSGGDWRVWPVDPVVKVFRETPPPRKKGSPAVALARNEEEALQLAVRAGRDIPDLRVEADPPRNPAGRELATPSVGWVETVPVDHRTGYYYLETPEWELKQPTHEGVSDGWAGWWPDPIRPGASGSLAANRTQAVWLSFKTAADTPAGVYRGEVRFVAGGKVLETVPYAVTVWDFALPERPSFTAVYDVRLTSPLWRSDGLSDAARRERVIRFMASKKICPDSVGASLRFTRDGQGRAVCDFSEYDREAAHYFDELHFPTSYMPGIFSIFNWEHLPKPFLKEKPYEGEYPYPGADRAKLRPAYKKAYQECLRLYWEHVKAKGWSDRLVLYISDEPFLDKKPIVEQMAALCDMIHEVDPKIRIYSSTWRHCPGWNGHLDIWGAGHYGCFPVEEMKARQAAGERVWFTTDGQMCLDTPFCAVERLLPHYGFQYGVETYEFWGVSWLTYDPWKFGWPRFYQNSVTPGKSRYVRFPSGDGCLLYPGAPVGVDGVATTVRLEAVRDGVEDYEYLRLLKTLAGATGDQEASDLLKAFGALTAIPNAGGRYSTRILPEPGRLAELRLRAGGVIERLSRSPVRAKGLAATAQGKDVVTGRAGEMRWGVKGLSLAPRFADCPASEATGEDVWTLTLEPAPGFQGSDEVVLNSSAQPSPTVKRTKSGLKMVYDTLTDGKRTFEIALTLAVRGAEDAFEVDGEIRNGTKAWLVKGFAGPVFSGIRTELERTPLLMPNGFGCRICALPEEGKEAWPWRRNGKIMSVSADYPSAAGTMQWFAFAGEKGGLYFGSHDARYGSKTLKVSYDAPRKTFGALFQHRLFVHPGERGAVPKVVVKPYAGDWHAAARFYRAWVDSVEKPIEKPAWVKTSTGWLLTILKQQNGEIVWPYGTLDQLGALAEERGLDTVGLFGWGYGGHDHLYPDYNPCPLMGGEKALREGIAKVHARGKKVILYANGYMMERGTAFWTATGERLAVTGKDRETTVQEFWRKYSDTAGYHFDLACTVTRAWRERLLSLAMQAHDFGADGILFDQLGGRGPMPCYAEGHGHPVPSMVYADDRKKMLREIAATMKGVDPDFVIMTEGFFDALLDSVTYFHGYLLGIFKDSAERIARQQAQPQTNGIFPELVRYTYPETICTVRFPSPLIDRQMANYTCTYGWRLEIETRYAPDRDYLLHRVPPKVEDYGKIVEKPSVELMRELPFDATVTYMKQVAVFQKKNAALLMTGTFTDTEGFTCKGNGIVAKGYRSGDAFGVMLWNTAEQPAAFELSVPNAEWVSASEPESDQVEAFSKLAPQTVRLLVWRSNETAKIGQAAK